MTLWLLDTQLLVDWCLWALADDPEGAGGWAARANNARSVLRTGRDRDGLVRFLERRSVAVAEHTFVEAGGVLRRLLTREHRGQQDRLNEPIVRSVLRFTERFPVHHVRVKEDSAAAALRELNDPLSPAERFDLGDAALLAAVSGDRRLVTADFSLYQRCSSDGRKDVFLFEKGDVRDWQNQVLDTRR